MYYKDKKETYTSNTVEHFGVNDSKFPLWLLIVIISIIFTIGFGFLYMMRYGKKSQNFGFRFY